ncbi:MAG TPA: tripartite tricarboxylate transporter substrate binding protein [Pseudolabrys sp.]|nr:tripartite tricarboxylate transporter substrate binding protein [Pseudolabrys sp.]
MARCAGILLMSAAGGLASTVTPAAFAQTPQTIRIVVPLPPGGAGDTLARQLAEQIGQSHGPTVVIENRPGAGSIIGSDLVAHAAADGGTLLMNAPYLLIGAQVRKVNYDPLKSFEPVCYLVSSPGIIVVNASSPYRTLADLLDAARDKPGALTLASVGPATAQHIGFERLKRAAGVDMTYVPYGGGAPAISALLGNHVTAVFAEYAPLASHIKAGTLRALATTSRTHIAPLPDLPTVAESGFADFEVDLWWSLFAPAKTPKDTVAQLAKLFSDAVESPSVKAKLMAEGFSPVAMCGGDFAVLLRKQYEDYGRVIREANIKSE